MNETDAERELRRFIESRPEATLSADDPSLASFEKLIRFIAENKPYAGVRDGIWWDPHILWAIKNAGSGGGGGRYPALINSSMPVPVFEQGSKNYFGDHYSLRSRTTGWAYGSSGANFFQASKKNTQTFKFFFVSFLNIFHSLPRSLRLLTGVWNSKIFCVRWKTAVTLPGG